MIATLAEAALRSFVLGGVVWFGLHLFRVRNPHMHMTAWVMVLAASLAMPFVMHWPTLTITRLPVAMPVPGDYWFNDGSPAELQPPLPVALGAAPTPSAGSAAPVNWWLLATTVYATVAGLLLLRLAFGLCLTWRLVRAARPMREPGIPAADVRVSGNVGGPVTFGSTILVPPQFVGWDAQKRRAVIAHEGAHVANLDFYVLLLGSLNRAVFWFSPFSWWQLARLSELAEIISDAKAIEVIEDRLFYAEILLDVAGSPKARPMEVAMARASTVHARIERIVAAGAMPPAVGWRKRLWIAASIVPAVIVSAGMIAYRTPDPGLAVDNIPEATTAPRGRSFVDFYSLGQSSVFAIFHEGDELLGQLTGQRRLRLKVSDGTASYATAAGEMTFVLAAERRPSELVLHRNGRNLHAIRLAELPRASADAAPLDQYVGWYQVTPRRVLSVSRDGERLRAQESGRPALEIAADGLDAFSADGGDVLVFLRDARGGVARVLWQNALSGARLAPRIDAAAARTIEADFARQIAEAPDRFREQIPAPGGKEAILRGIEDMRRGTPNYDRMSATLAAKIRRQVSELRATFQALGSVESIFFRGVGPGGYDIYGAKFANGTAEFRLMLEPDGEVADVIFRPDGNDEPGGVVACSEEARVRSRAGHSPIKIMLYNDTGSDIQVYSLGADGNRKPRSVLGDNMSAWFQTSTDSAWLVADGSGRCLEIVLPGQRTRYHTVERSGGRREYSVPRTTPLAGADDLLRQYIEAVGRGQPNYDRMTAEVAAQTRQQLPFDQAILTRLGALRAMSFRGVSALGSDVYVAQFANGSAEWRIGVRDGTITRIALGPQY